MRWVGGRVVRRVKRVVVVGQMFGWWIGMVYCVFWGLDFVDGIECWGIGERMMKRKKCEEG